MFPLPFALFELAPERISAFVTYVLSIIGGAVAGYLLAVVIGRLFDRIVLGKGQRSADVLHTIFRILTALGVAILVAMLMFPGGGGGTGTGDGPETGPDKPAVGGGPDPKVPPTPPTPKPVLDEKEIGVIRLDILGGSDVKNSTDFYRVDGRREQLTLDELGKLVSERRAALKPDVGIAIEYRYTRYTDEGFHGTTLLRRWATEKKITIRPADTNGN